MWGRGRPPDVWVRLLLQAGSVEWVFVDVIFRSARIHNRPGPNQHVTFKVRRARILATERRVVPGLAGSLTTAAACVHVWCTACAGYRPAALYHSTGTARERDPEPRERRLRRLWAMGPHQRDSLCEGHAGALAPVRVTCTTRPLPLTPLRLPRPTDGRRHCCPSLTSWTQTRACVITLCSLTSHRGP